MTTCDTLLAVVTGLIAASVAINAFNRHVKGGWSDQRLRAVAAKMVETVRFAENAGVDLVEPASLDLTIRRIAEGRSLETGPYAGKLFYGVPELDEKGKIQVRPYLRLVGGGLVLIPHPEPRRES